MLHCSKTGQRVVHPRLPRLSEPGIVGQIDQQVRIDIIHRGVDESGQDIFVADHHSDALVAQLQRS